MIRRTFLKMLLASPLAGFLKAKPEVQMDNGNMSGDSTFTFVAETTGTSGRGRFFTLELKDKSLEDNPEVMQWLDETERELNREYLLDPMHHWAKECAKEYQTFFDDVIIKALRGK